MSRLLLFSIVFIEGFCSLGAEVIALTPIRDKAFECISFADLPERLRQLAG